MKILFHSGRIHTQAPGVVADSIAISGNRVVAVGRRLEYDSNLSSYSRFDLRGRTVIPGLVDAHTHLFQVALSLDRVSVEGVTSVSACQWRIKQFADKRPARSWIIGSGYAADLFPGMREPDRHHLDAVTGGRPAFIYSKDTHSAWVNSRALQLGGIGRTTPDPVGGRIERDGEGMPTGILREQSAIDPIWLRISHPSGKHLDRLFNRTLDSAYRNGVTGVHSFDGPEAFKYFATRATSGNLGLRINYYPREHLLGELEHSKTRYGAGDEFLRIAGVKLFADGALGSRTALCFNRYLDGDRGRGIEVTSVRRMKATLKRAARLGFPCAIHAIGDRAAANVLEAMEASSPPRSGARHRIEHLQLVRRKDLARLKRLGVIASMQPSHCTSDIEMVRAAWGWRGRNAYLFRKLLDGKIKLAFGSDAPIEALDPLAGIAAAVRRARQGSRDVFYPEQRITAAEAIRAFTVGPAVAAGQEHCRGFLLPGYPADMVILSDDPTRIPASRLYDIAALATILGGEIKYAHSSLKL